ncbi:chorion peroxidase isoform X2 [Condylostylus longicornis]|nr:chorion peroxidase isoform X2 [Condylostylus longicornis]
MTTSIPTITPLPPSERTPLTRLEGAPGPSYVFPGVSPRSRRKQMRQFQCCICSIFITATILALIIGIYYSDMDPIIPNQNNMSTTTNEPTIDLNETEILLLLSDQKIPIPDEKPSKWVLPIPSIEEAVAAKDFGLRALGDREIYEESLIPMPINSPSFRHFHAIVNTPDARSSSKKGYVEYHATFHVARKYNYTRRPGARNNIGEGPLIDLSNNTLTNVKCNFNSRYRKINGFCNNKNHPTTFGVALLSYRRALAPDYSDGINNPRAARSGNPLPSARQVSLNVHRPVYTADPNFTVMLAVFGQLLDHDITATALNAAQEGQPIDCCQVPLNQHPECFPVPLVPGDPYFDQYNLTCMNFVRSAPAPTGRFSPREQFNQATAFIDASMVYGNTEEKINLLRSRTGGKLRMFRTPDNRDLLPLSNDPKDGCNQAKMNAQGKYCFQSGDERANENLHLTSIHLIFARHHNFLATNLQQINPQWNDEMLFQESRKILGAQIQHIAYNEFLPILLGYEFVKSKNLLPNPQNARDMYDPDVNPTIANHFAAAVFRFAHTLLPSLFKMTRDNTTDEQIELHRMLFNPYSLWEEKGVDQALKSAVDTPIMKVDGHFSRELTEKLFQVDSPDELIPSNITDAIPNKQAVCGLDLVSLNIQRGRDHGLPSYTEFRKHCKLPTAKTWDDMEKLIDPTSVENMKLIYETPMDVDLYTGALSEPPLEGAIFGPLLACLISDQFIRLKVGDSFWYERKFGPQRFSNDQLNEIYRTTLAGIICQNSDNVVKIPKLVMQSPNNSTNPYVNCTEIINFNFSPWMNEKFIAANIKLRLGAKPNIITIVKNNNGTIPKNKLV